MILMNHRVYREEDEAPGTGLVVHAMSVECGHMWNVEVSTEARMSKEIPRQIPKHYYRFAENVLLSGGKVRYAKTKAGEPTRLVCKECGVK